MKKITATLILIMPFVLAYAQHPKRADRKLRLPKTM